MRTLEIGKNDAGQRLDKFLQKRFKTMPKSMMYMYIRKKCIKRNGKKCDIDVMLREGDVLTFYIKDEFFEQSAEKNYEFLKAPTKLEIVYEDKNLLLLDKKPGVIVHPDKNYHFDSLVARVQHYLYEKGEYDPESEQAFAPALVNRIDRNTGGIVIAAKNAESLRILNLKMKTRELEKYYLCLIHGKPKQDSGILTGYITKNESQNKVTVLSRLQGNPHPVQNSRFRRAVQSCGNRAADGQDAPDPRTHGVDRLSAGRRHEVRQKQESARRLPPAGALQLQTEIQLYGGRGDSRVPQRQGI